MSEEMKTPTPRTNQVCQYGPPDSYLSDKQIVYADFARTLETVINTCASMLGITDSEINNSEHSLKYISELMQIRIARMQENVASIDVLQDEKDQLQSTIKTQAERIEALEELLK